MSGLEVTVMKDQKTLQSPVVDVDPATPTRRSFLKFGAQGIGEIGVTGLAAAVANAVYHATGQRVRSLPITKEKLMAVR